MQIYGVQIYGVQIYAFCEAKLLQNFINPQPDLRSDSSFIKGAKELLQYRNAVICSFLFMPELNVLEWCSFVVMRSSALFMSHRRSDGTRKE